MVVTGAGQGLGRAFAEDAARAGAAVVVNDVEGDLAEAVAAGIRGFGGRASASVNSVKEPEQAEAIIADCVSEFGRIDGLVNNAGLRHRSPLAEEEPGRARELIEVNVLGTLYCGMAAAKAMESGSIVNIGSVSMVGQPNVTTYSASKGAVASLTVGWAVELAERNIRVNAICPIAKTRMGEDGAPPEETAPIVTYLLSDAARNVTGQLIRFANDQLFVIRQVAPKSPIVEDEVWDFADAFDNWLECEAPPRDRWQT